MALGASRKFHEDFVINNINMARAELISAGSQECDRALKGTVLAAKAVARARAHLVSIGKTDSKRTRKLWIIVSRQDRHVDARVADLLKECVVKR